MLKKLLLSMGLIIWAALASQAQVTYSPVPLQESSQDVTVYFHADQGNKALANLGPSEQVYAHTGVLTSLSKTDSDWKYAPTWGKNEEKYLLTYVSENLYKMYIGDIRTYYGVKSPTEVIEKLAFVFRTADCKKEAKTSDGSDIFIDVAASGQQIALETSLDGNIITPDNAKVKFSFGSTEAADLSISINGTTIASKENATLLETEYTFTEPGNYIVYGNAKKGEEVKSTNLKLYYVTPSPQVNYPGGVPKMGAVRSADGKVTFCIAAPGKTTVLLAGSWNDYSEDLENTMNYQDYNGFRYFWKTVEGLDETSMYPYYFLVDGNLRVGDPYAKLVLDPYNDKYISKDVFPDLPAYPTDKVRKVVLGVYQENINDFAWTDQNFVRPDKNDLVIYELLLRDFTGTEGQSRGNGTINKALEKIDYLKHLGVNVIELMPVNEFNGNNSWGYNPNFYFAPDKAYGTPDDYKNFINVCHENGIAVVLDMVFNQSDGLHPWYQMYNISANPFYNMDAPHAYNVLNDWNQGYELVRQQWKDVVKYWIEEYHVDGYRFDLVKGLGDNDSYANSGDSGTNAYNASRVANMRAIQKAMDEVSTGAYFINENLAGAKEENEMAETGMMNWANVNNAGCQYAMGYQSGAALNRFSATKDSRTFGSTVSYLESHDEERLAYKQTKWGMAAVKNDHAVAMRRCGSAAAQMILCPGAHMIWQFSEMGNAQTTKNADGGNNTDPKKVNWSLLDDPDNNGLYQNYSELISIRLSNPELFSQSSNFSNNCVLWNEPRAITASNGAKELICVINPSLNAEKTYNYAFASAKEDNYQIASKSYGTNPSFDVAAGTITVPANSYVLVTSKSVSAVDEVSIDKEPGLYARGIGGAIAVENAPDGFEVYSLSGQAIARSAEVKGEIAVQPGVYVVKSGADAVKVIVK